MSSLPAATVGTLLKRYRRAAGLTQEALAEQAGISADTISELERLGWVTFACAWESTREMCSGWSVPW